MRARRLRFGKREQMNREAGSLLNSTSMDEHPQRQFDVRHEISEHHLGGSMGSKQKLLVSKR